jgi:hypothetical protein
MVTLYRRFGATYRSHVQGSRTPVVKGEVVPANAMRAYKGYRGIAPLILELTTIRR